MAGVIAAMLLAGLQQSAMVPAAAPPPPDAKTLVDRYNQATAVAPPVVDRCDENGTADITVCGSRHSDQRLPLADENGPTLPAARSRDQTLCVASGGGPCPVCPPTGCTGVNLLAVPFKLFRIVKAIVSPDD